MYLFWPITLSKCRPTSALLFSHSKICTFLILSFNFIFKCLSSSDWADDNISIRCTFATVSTTFVTIHSKVSFEIVIDISCHISDTQWRILCFQRRNDGDVYNTMMAAASSFLNSLPLLEFYTSVTRNMFYFVWKECDTTHLLSWIRSWARTWRFRWTSTEGKAEQVKLGAIS